MDTIRRYPRTLAEAFPHERACALERPRPTRRVLRGMGWLFVGAMGLVLVTVAVRP
jgi:hypothetical protein